MRRMNLLIQHTGRSTKAGWCMYFSQTWINRMSYN